MKVHEIRIYQVKRCTVRECCPGPSRAFPPFRPSLLGRLEVLI